MVYSGRLPCYLLLTSVSVGDPPRPHVAEELATSSGQESQGVTIVLTCDNTFALGCQLFSSEV